MRADVLDRSDVRVVRGDGRDAGQRRRLPDYRRAGAQRRVRPRRALAHVRRVALGPAH